LYRPERYCFCGFVYCAVPGLFWLRVASRLNPLPLPRPRLKESTATAVADARAIR
jgi:hypothetical protein